MNNINKLTDSEIQQIMDSKTPSPDKSEIKLINEDAYLYDILIKNLETKPSVIIPDDFAEKTRALAFRRKTFRDMIWEVVVFLSVSIPLIAVCLSVVYFLGQDILWEIIDILKSGGTYILFVIIGIVSIQLLDKALIQNKLRQFYNH